MDNNARDNSGFILFELKIESIILSLMKVIIFFQVLILSGILFRSIFRRDMSEIILL